MAKPRSKTKKILFAVEILVLLLFIGGLYVYGQFSSKMDKIQQPAADTSQIEVNQEVQDSIDSETSKLTGYTTYALFGIDHRDKSSAGGMNSDTMIIACVNNDTKDVRLASVYRDTLLNVYGDTYSKANAAYAKSPADAVSMLNRNFDLNIQHYATVNFNALASIVDALGGLDIAMSYAEIVHMNNYCVETSEDIGKSYTPIELPERPEDIEKIDYTYRLNGVQATSYCRIRYTASLDMGRTERQRKVIQLIVQKAKKAGLSTIFDIMDQVFPMVETSVSKTEILQLLPAMIGYSLNETTGFPSSFKFARVNKASMIVPTAAGSSDVDLVSNVIELHKFLYGDEAYTPSSTVQEISDKIKEITSEMSLEDTQVVDPEIENTPADNIIFENDGNGWTDNSGGDTGSEDVGSGDGSGDGEWTDPGTGDGSGSGDGEWTDPGTGDGSGSGDGEWTDPGTGDGSGSGDRSTGGGDTGSGDGSTGGGDTSGGDGSTGGGDTSGGDTGGGDAPVDPGTGGGDTSGGDTSGGDMGGDMGELVPDGGSSDGGAVSEGESAPATEEAA